MLDQHHLDHSVYGSQEVHDYDHVLCTHHGDHVHCTHHDDHDQILQDNLHDVHIHASCFYAHVDQKVQMVNDLHKFSEILEVS